MYAPENFVRLAYTDELFTWAFGKSELMFSRLDAEPYTLMKKNGTSEKRVRHIGRVGLKLLEQKHLRDLNLMIKFEKFSLIRS